MAEDDNNKQNWLKDLLKVLLIIVVVLVALVVVAFGLLVGICTLGSRH
jgi:hypothetical protein